MSIEKIRGLGIQVMMMWMDQKFEYLENISITMTKKNKSSDKNLWPSTQWFVFFMLLCHYADANVRSTNHQLDFDANGDGVAEMTLLGANLGIGVTSPSANLQVAGNVLISDQLIIGDATGSENLIIAGSIGFSSVMLSSDTSLGLSSIVMADTTSDNITLQLPYAGNAIGRCYQIKKIDPANSVWLLGGGNLIDASEPLELSASNIFLPSVKVMSDGKQWYIIESYMHSATVASSNLVGWWRLDTPSGNTFTDHIGYGHDAVAVNIASSNLSVTSKIGNGVDFDGTNDYLQVENTEQLRGMPQLSLSAWVYVRSKTNFDRFIDKSDNDGSNSQRSYRLMLDNTTDKKAIAKFFATGGVATMSADNALPLLTWVHLVATYDGSQLSLYSDNVLQGTPVSLSGNILGFSDAKNTLSFGHGQHINADNFALDGLMDETRIYNRALTPDEVYVLFKQGH